MSKVAPNVALDALFRRNATARGELQALHDLDGVSLTYTQTANAVAHVAEQITTLGMAPRSVIALLLPNGRELVVALLAVLRSGHVAVTMPVAWRKSDLVRACREAEAAALITTANFSAENLPLLATEVATEVFELSFPCAFGASLPDGILPLTFNTAAEPVLATAAIASKSDAGIGTFQPVSGGVSLVLHHDDELLAAGLGAMLAGDMRGGDTIVSAISFSTYAGLASALVPWLLSSGTLTLLPELPSKGAIEFDKNTHLIASAGSLPMLSAVSPSAVASAFAVHFAGTEALTAYPALNAETLVDVIVLGEVCAVALPRRERSMTATLPLGAIHAGNAGAGSPVILETRIEKDQLQVRGAMVPGDAIGSQEWLDTNFVPVPLDGSAVHLSPPEDLLALGALRFSCADLERRIRSAALVMEVHAIDDPVMGAKLVITSERPAETTKALLDAGLPRLVAHAVQKADAFRAKAG
jgi:hypothetical protein